MISTTKIQLTKLDIVLHQLETAVTLWFNRGDDISIHTLASSAYQIVYDLNKHTEGSHNMLPDSEYIRPEKRSEFKTVLKKSYNYMKHANNDPTKILLFNPGTTEFVLLEAITYYTGLAKKSTPLFKFFYIWMTLQCPDIFVLSFVEHVRKNVPINHIGDVDRVEFFKYFSDSSYD